MKITTAISKRISALMLAIMMCFGMFPAAALAADDGNMDQTAAAEPVHEHTWGEWAITKPATCSETGEKQRICMVCKETEKAVISSLPHSFGEWMISEPSTCSAEGIELHECTVCGATETAAISVIPHTFGDWEVTKEPTCTEAGEQQRTCTVCDEIETAAVPVVPHTFGDWEVTKEPTCTEKGKREHICTVCGKSKSESIPVVPHSFGDWEVTREATCTKEGKQEHTCTVCGEVEKESIPVIPHSFGDWEVTREATCTKEGKQEHTCTVCGEVEKESIPVIPHSFGDWEVTREATCTKEGKQEHTCIVCGEVEKESMPVIPHSFGDWEVTREATCTKEGKQEHTCTVCGEVEKKSIPVTEHDWDEDDVCTVCGAGKEKATYTVLWLSEDGKELEKDEKVPEGTFPSFDGTTPAKDKDDDYTYEFSGWNPEPAAVTEDAVYTAQFTKTERRSDAMEKTETIGTLIVSVSAPEGAFPWGTEIRISAAAMDVSSIAEKAELVCAAQLSFIKNDEAQTAESPVAVSISMLDARNEQDTYKVVQSISGTVIANDYGSSFSVTEAAVFGVVRIPAEPFKVMFDPDNGEELILVSVEAGSVIGVENIPDTPVKKDCDFEKWIDAEDENTVITAETVVTGDMTVLAAYKRQMPAVSFYKSTGGVYVGVTAEEGTFPAGTEMTVTPLGSDSSLESLSNDQNTEVVATRVVDITFWFEGDEIQPEKPVSVTLGVAWYDDEQSIDVVHYSDGGVSVVASDVSGTTASFAAEHFSSYGVIVKAKPPMWMTENGSFREGFLAKSVEDLIDKPFYISIMANPKDNDKAKNTYFLMDETVTVNSVTHIKRTAANDIGSAAVYYFEGPDENGKYNIRTQGGQYLEMGTTSTESGYSLYLTTENKGTSFTVEVDSSGMVKIYDQRGTNKYYLNLRSEDAGVGFRGYKDPNANGVNLLFSEEVINCKDYTYDDPYELDGTECAIAFVSGDKGKVMTADDSTSGKLNIQSVSVTTDGGNPVRIDTLDNSELITWTFERDKDNQDTKGGHYYLKWHDSASNKDWYFQFDPKVPTDINLVDNRNDATVISVSPGTIGGKTADGKMTEGKYRFSWTTGKESNSVALSVEDHFYGWKENSWAQSGGKRQQWLYLFSPPHKVTYSYTDEEPSGRPDPPGEKTYDYGATVPAAPIPIMEGYTFDGWKGEISTMPAKDVEVTGSWTINSHKVTYLYAEPVPTGAPPVPAEATYDYNAKVTVADAPTMTGYNFSGWSKTGSFQMPDEDVTITGSWQANSYTVKFAKNATDAEGTMEDQSFKYDEEKGLTANTFKRTGYTFKGWGESATSTTVKYADKASVKNLVSKDGGSITLYAIWEAKTGISYTVHYYLKDTTKKVTDDKTVGDQSYGAKVTEKAIKVKGYKAVAPTEKTITIAESGNEIIFYYEPVNDDKVVVTISGAHWTHIYDGEPHWDIGYIAVSNNKEYNKGINDGHGNDPNIKYTGSVTVGRTNVGIDSVDLRNVKFENRNPNFTNVKFVILNDCYTTYEITPRTVVMTSDSAEKHYDGSPLTSEKVTVTGDGFVKDEGASYAFTGSQTEEGSSQNTFTYTLNLHKRAVTNPNDPNYDFKDYDSIPENYKITTNYGTLTVLTAVASENDSTGDPKETPAGTDHGTSSSDPDGEDKTTGADSSDRIRGDDTISTGNAWALLNLIAAILTVGIGGGMLASSSGKKNAGEDEGMVRAQNKSKLLGLIPGAGSVAAFFLTENLKADMVLADKWTILMVAILGIGSALAYLTRNKEP